jgi:hypothetical protein
MNYVVNAATNWIVNADEISNQRRTNYFYLSKQFNEIGVRTSFQLDKHEVPGVFMFDLPKSVNPNELKLFLNSYGCQSSVFYGRNQYFVPTHQNLTAREMNYIVELYGYYLEHEI